LENFLRRAVDGEIRNECYDVQDTATYRGADKSLALSGSKQARKHVRDARGFNKIKARAVIKFLFLQGKAPKGIHAILTETLACFFPGRAKDLSAPMYKKCEILCVNWTAGKKYAEFCELGTRRTLRYFLFYVDFGLSTRNRALLKKLIIAWNFKKFHEFY